MAFPSLHPERLVGKIGKLMVSDVGNHLDHLSESDYSGGVRRHRLNKGGFLFKRTRYQHGSVELRRAEERPCTYGYTAGGKKTSTGSSYTASSRLGMWRHIQANLRRLRQRTLFD